MIHVSALSIATFLSMRLMTACEETPDGRSLSIKIAGGLRRGKPDVHDIEIVAKPILTAPRAEFGQKKPFATLFDRELQALQDDGYLFYPLKNGPKMKQFPINLDKFKSDVDYSMPSVDLFTVEFYLVTPPAEWGVDLVIRTGPGSESDNFSQWVVTQRSRGGALPDGYRVKHAAVWRVEQLDAKDNPLPGERPLSMPTEQDFFDFLELPWIEPADRHAKWGRR